MAQKTLPPGFRFSPTDEELVSYYLKSKAFGRNYHRATIADVDIYKFEPWDLPGKSALPSKDQEWYFFSTQDKKYSHTARINRTTKKGYWKATGKDRKVFSGSTVIGLKKTLIYYEGRAPNGSRTNWIMHEYRLDEEFEKKDNVVCSAVLCRIRKKGGPGPRNGEQYVAPTSNGSLELGEEATMRKVDDGVDTVYQDDVESKGGGDVFNLGDQVEVWKQMGSSNVELDHVSIKEDKETKLPKTELDYNDLENVPYRKEMIECDPGLNAFFQSISDFDLAPSIYEYGGDNLLGYHQGLDLQNQGTLFDLDIPPFFPTLSDAHGLLQDYTGPAFDESDILKEMSDLINDGKGVASRTGSMTLPAPCSVPSDGDYIELNDINAPLDSLALRPPVQSSKLGRSEEQQLGLKADMKVDTCRKMQDLLHLPGSAADRAWLPNPASKGGLKAANTVLSQAEKCIHGGDISIPIPRESYGNAGKHHSGFYSGAGDLPPVVQSSTRSYLSKHVSTYAVSKHEMLPGQLCYASSFTDGQNCVVTVNNPPTACSTAFAIKSNCNMDAYSSRKLPTTLIDSSLSYRLLTNSKKVPTDDPEDIPFTPVISPLSSGPSIESSHPNVEVPTATQGCDQEAEHANINYSNRHRWKTSFAVLVSTVKRSALGTRLMQLENGMRAKFNDKLSALGKPVARFLPFRGNASPYESLRKGLVATLCHLAAAVLIFFCLFWGFRVIISYAFSVAV